MTDPTSSDSSDLYNQLNHKVWDHIHHLIPDSVYFGPYINVHHRIQDIDLLDGALDNVLMSELTDG